MISLDRFGLSCIRGRTSGGHRGRQHQRPRCSLRIIVMPWTGMSCRRRQARYGASANVSQLPQLHQSCVRTELSAANCHNLRFKCRATPAAGSRLRARRPGGTRHRAGSANLLHRHPRLHRGRHGPAALLGFELAPRIRDIHDQTLYKLDHSQHYPHLDLILTGAIKAHRSRRLGMRSCAWLPPCPHASSRLP